jgi:hypothetical protein
MGWQSSESHLYYLFAKRKMYRIQNQPFADNYQLVAASAQPTNVGNGTKVGN